jgi:cell division protein FtsN
MARDYKHIARNHSKRRRPPPWVWLMVGLTLGLFIAFLVYLNEHKTSEVTTNQSRLSIDQPAEAPPVAAAPKPKMDSPEEKPKPRFEFYTILPEMEVHVPEQEVASPPPRQTTTKPPPTAGTSYTLQVGSFEHFTEADRLKARLALMGLEAEIQSVSVDGSDTWHRVRMGPFTDLEELNRIRVRLREHGLEALVLKQKP